MTRRIAHRRPQLQSYAGAKGAAVICASAAPDLGFDRLMVRGGQLYIVEVKDGSKPPSKRQLTDGEQKCKRKVEAAGGRYWIIESDADLLAMFGLG